MAQPAYLGKLYFHLNSTVYIRDLGKLNLIHCLVLGYFFATVLAVVKKCDWLQKKVKSDPKINHLASYTKVKSESLKHMVATKTSVIHDICFCLDVNNHVLSLLFCNLTRFV